MENKTYAIFLGLILLFSISFVIAEQQTLKPVTKGECATIPQSHPNATGINITKIRYPDDTENYTVIPMNTSNGFNFYYDFCNTSQVGDYVVTTCGDGDGIITCMDFDFPVTPNGKESNIQTALIQILIIVFFVGLIGAVYFMKRKIEFDNWSKSLFEKYAQRNLLKFVMGAIAYNVMKHSFILYYLLGLPILISISDLSFIYNLTDISAILSAITMIYTVGIIVVGLIFFSYAQEWLVDIFNKIKDMEWGIE